MASDSIELYKYIGQNIKTIRKKYRISVDDLAASANVSSGTIRNMESGASASLPVLLDISKRLGVPFESLIFDFTLHKTPSDVNPIDIEIFLEAYHANEHAEPRRLMNVIKAFLEE